MYKKGLTPIIAIVLLLMMTIAAFGLAYVWLTSFQEQTQSEVQAVVQEKLSQLGSQLEIASVYKDPAGDNTIVLIYNSGRNIISADLVESPLVMIDNVRVDIINGPDGDVPPLSSFEYTLDYNFQNFKDNDIHTITIKFGDIEVTYQCGPIPSTSDTTACPS